ncbi:DUF4198 domain-containing protein [Bremerella sp. JC817]|uniref:DUF4198 domain-containing protein n=1 Tax=Bremerella sp. JC817 TaxID=3231756 RepID=UPI003458F422
MKFRHWIATSLALTLVVTFGLSAHAHFVWVALSQPNQASLYFGEGPEPSEADLLDRVQQSEVFARMADGKYVPLKLEKLVEGTNGSWTVQQPDAQWQGLEAVCDYGVLAKGGSPFWLKYYAKYIDNTSLANATLCDSQKLPLDIVPSRTADGIQLQVQFDGKPVAEAEVVIQDDAYNETKTKTDAAGNVLLKDAKPVTYTVRAKFVEEKPGDQDGKKYDTIRHYSTVTLNLADDSK